MYRRQKILLMVRLEDSRLNIKKFLASKRWFQGPEFLQQHDDDWPSSDCGQVDEKHLEVRKTKKVKVNGKA